MKIVISNKQKENTCFDGHYNLKNGVSWKCSKSSSLVRPDRRKTSKQNTADPKMTKPHRNHYFDQNEV